MTLRTTPEPRQKRRPRGTRRRDSGTMGAMPQKSRVGRAGQTSQKSRTFQTGRTDLTETTSPKTFEERLHKTIARSGLASRRQAEQIIAEGRVRVGGEIVTRVGAKVDPRKDDIRVDGVRVRPDRPRRYILLNKPTGYLTTRSDPRRRPTVMQLLPIAMRSLFPVGRLDMATSGLLLLTDDGDFALRVAHPRYGITKTYAVTVRGVPSERSLQSAKKGIRGEGQLLRVSSVHLLSRSPQRARRRGAAGGRAAGVGPRGIEGSPQRARRRGAAGGRAGALSSGRLPSEERGSTKQSDGVGPRGRRRRAASKKPESTRLRVVLNEGRYREIWRLFKALGHPVIELHREKVGFLDDRGLASGAFRPLDPGEISRLLGSSVAGPKSAARGRPARGPRGVSKKRRRQD